MMNSASIAVTSMLDMTMRLTENWSIELVLSVRIRGTVFVIAETSATRTGCSCSIVDLSIVLLTSCLVL